MKKSIYIYLIYFVVISFVVTGISFSRYSSAIAGSAYATAASPVVRYLPEQLTLNGLPASVSEDGISIGDLKPGDVLVYDFTIRNYRESTINQVLMKYRISVTFSPSPSTIPVTYQVTPNGVYPPAGDGWTYMGFGTNETHSYTLTITWNEADNDPAYLNQQQDIQIHIDAQQVDS